MASECRGPGCGARVGAHRLEEARFCSRRCRKAAQREQDAKPWWDGLLADANPE